MIATGSRPLHNSRITTVFLRAAIMAIRHCVRHAECLEANPRAAM
jgi:hypothetical protein